MKSKVNDLTKDAPEHSIAAIIAAGGVGSRFATNGRGMPKQLYLLKGKPLYMWCLLAFCAHPKISGIVLVAHPAIVSGVFQEVGESIASGSLIKGADNIVIVSGGETRQESVFIGLQHLAEADKPVDYVLIHDAARPFLTSSLIDRTIECVVAHGACTVAVPVSDTIKRVRSDTITDTIDRSNLYAVHTPQAARFDWLIKAHEDAKRDAVSATDDAYLLERSGHEVKIVEGDRYNIKVTVPDDLQVCEALAPLLINQNIGQINGSGE